MQISDYNTINQRQRYVQESGEKWESFVMNYANRGLKAFNSDLRVIKGKAIPKHSLLWEKLSIPVGKPGSTKKIWGDVDLVVIDKQKNPFAVISCKTSLHGRFSETLFYAGVMRKLVARLRVVFATPDKGRQQRGPWQSEWGSEEKPTKDRLLGSHYLNGIYVYNPKTKLGGTIKSMEDLAKDLIKWHKLD